MISPPSCAEDCHSRSHPPPPPGFPARTITIAPNAPHSPDPTDAAAPPGAPAPTLLDRLFDYNLYPSCHARDLLTDEYRPDPRDGENRHRDPSTTDNDDPQHSTDSLAFLDLFLEKDLSLRRKKEILEEYLLK